MDIQISTEGQRQFEELPTLVKVRILKIFERLTLWPDVSGAKPLRGALAGQFRMRTGDYRVQFRVETTLIMIVKVGHREGFYDDQN